ncbi:unnamed protein product [Psylliodes chrysocephalus]|uniref:Sushi domain-containing protein n=1 Tax=Psylliodes chrysocephalus TaxID=3402493 RepID=A0A9P0CEP7_9CUCU|nr:unnamed protein product [Psylliodes chrysocephala]
MSLKRYIYLNFVATVFLYVNGNPVSNATSSGECVLPIYPPKGKWSIIGGPDTNPGSKVPLNTIITFSCDKKYKLSSDYSVITCLGGDWDLPPPQCLYKEETHQVKRQLYFGKEEYNPGGGRGGDGIVIGSGGRRTVIGPGEEGSSHYDESGDARGGQGGTGVTRGGGGKGGSDSQGGSGWTGNTGQGGEGPRGQDGLVIGKDETVNGYAIGVGQPGGNGEQTGGRGGDGAVVNGGGRVNGVLIGIGGDGGSSGSNNKNQGKQGAGKGSRPGGISGGTNGYSGQSGFGQGGFDQDGYGQEGTFNSRGQNTDFTGGRGGTGLVIRGGTVSGTVVGVGGQGGSSGGYYRRKRETHAEEVNPTLLEGEKGEALSKSQEDQVRTKRQSRIKSITTSQHLFVKVIKDGKTYDLAWHQGNHDPWNGQGGTSIGGTGGTGISLIDNPELEGILVGFGGQGGHTYIKRNKREVEEKNQIILQEKEVAKMQLDGDRIKRQATINGITYPGPILVGGRGGDGLIISGGVIQGFVVGYGGQGGSPNQGRKRRKVQEYIQQSFPDV